jgi:hypothetical protein
MGVANSSSQLQSGRPFTDVFVHSLKWLSDEGYVRSAGILPYEQVALTAKGLATLSAIPQGLSTTVGSTLATNASSRDWSGVDDLVGGIIGGFSKSIVGT